MAKKNGTANGKSNGHAMATAPTTAPRFKKIEEAGEPSRLPVLKTYKIYIGGKFPRTESGRYYTLKNKAGAPIANICKSSRKDFREAVVAARAAQHAWADRSAYNRGQILYRIAEMLEGRTAQFVEELQQTGATASAAAKEVALSVDRLLYYAGWADKYQQIFSSVNPVNSSHFNFSLLEPTGVVSVIAPQDSGLIGLVSVIAPAITGGNTVVALASTTKPLSAVTLAEVIATSDVPGGVVNILTGDVPELVDPMSNHMDVNATLYAAGDKADWAKIRTNAALNVKRVVNYGQDWMTDDGQSPYFILDVMETKTTWHPVGI
jgi:acyl-CoA reductase-like NAD-dependent aldehyde dehydrogenase